MGLDITAYQKARLLPEDSVSDDDHWESEHVRAFVYEGHEASLAGLLPGRWYKTSGREKSFGAGSYSGYNAFRDALSSAALGVSAHQVWSDPERWKDAPFYLLINFADNEGTIGPEACARLAKQFAEHRERVRPLLDQQTPDGWWGDCYDNWQEAFELAANRGLVDFH